MDESNATCGKRLASIGLENTEANRQAYRTLLVTAPGLGNYISGAILFEETLYQSTTEGKKMVDVLVEQNIVPGIKVDKVRHTIPKVVMRVSYQIPLVLFLIKCIFIMLCRVWFPWLVRMMNRGAKVSMVLPPAPLLTTNKVLALQNGKIFFLSRCLWHSF